LIKDGKTRILIDSKSVEQLKEAIIELLNNEHKMRSMGKEVHELIANNFTWE